MSLDKNFWSYDAYSSGLLVYGYVRDLKNGYQPTDIIELAFKYYQTFQVSFTEFSAYGDVEYIRSATWKPEKLISGTQIETEKSFRTIIEANVENGWGKKAKISLNGIENAVEYNFTIKCIKNMLNDGMIIGIRTDEIRPTAYFMRCIKVNKNEYDFYFCLYKHWRKERYSLGRGSGYWINTVTFHSGSNENTDKNTISLNLNCSTWRLKFFLNDEFVNCINVKSNECYIPIIATEKMGGIKYEVIKMNCNVINYSKNVDKKLRSDINKYLFSFIEDGWYSYVDTMRNLKSSKQVINLLWKGFKFIYFDENKFNSFADILRQHTNGYMRYKMWLILEIYQCFWEEFKYECVLDTLSKRKQSLWPYLGTISCIITDYVIDNFSKEYKKYHNASIRNAIRHKMKKGFVLNDLMGSGCPTCQESMGYKYTEIDTFEFNEEIAEMDANYGQCVFDHRKRYSEKVLLRKRKVKRRNNRDYYKKGKKFEKFRSYMKRTKDKRSKYESNKRFKKRYELSLQY